MFRAVSIPGGGVVTLEELEESEELELSLPLSGLFRQPSGPGQGPAFAAGAEANPSIPAMASADPKPPTRVSAVLRGFKELLMLFLTVGLCRRRFAPLI